MGFLVVEKNAVRLREGMNAFVRSATESGNIAFDLKIHEGKRTAVARVLLVGKQDVQSGVTLEKEK